MPKMIPELREQFIAAARQRLVYREEHDLTIRQIADDCRTGVGTVYNYFSSKDILIAEVLSDDWQRTRDDVEAKLFTSGSPVQDIQTVYEGLCLFLEKYQPTIDNYCEIPTNIRTRNLYHSMLIEPIGTLMKSILHCYSLNVEPYTDVALSEILVAMATHKKEQFAMIRPILCRILGIPASR